MACAGSLCAFTPLSAREPLVFCLHGRPQEEPWGAYIQDIYRTTIHTLPQIHINSSKQTYCSLNSFQRMIGGDSGELHISTQGILPPCQRFWLPAWVKRPAVTSAISASLNRGISSNLQNPRLATCLCFNPINPPLLHMEPPYLTASLSNQRLPNSPAAV